MNSRWLVIALVASLVLNLFLLGTAAGVFALGERLAKEGRPRPGAFVRATRELPAMPRMAFRGMLRQVWAQQKPAVTQSVALRAAAWSAIADPKPDLAAIKLKLAQSRQIDVATRTKVEEAVADYAAGMPADQRATFADGVRKTLLPADAKPQPTPAAH